MIFFLEYLNLFWWLILLFVAFYLWRWAQSHLGFSPILALVVGAVLIYYLVIEHPLIGVFGVGTWLVFSTGFLLMAGFFFPFLLSLFRKKTY